MDVPWADGRTLQDLGWPRLVQALVARAGSPCGREVAAAPPFLEGPEAIRRRLAQVDEVRALLAAGAALPVADVDDVRPQLRRARRGGTLSAAEVLACGRLLGAAAAARRFVAARREVLGLLLPLCGPLSLDSTLVAAIDAAIDPAGTLRDEASAELLAERLQVRRLQRLIKARLEGLMLDPAVAGCLQDSYFSVRGDRYVLPVAASFQAQVPGIVHNASQTGQTLFVEPAQVVPLGNELAVAVARVVQEEQRVLAALSADIGALAPACEAAQSSLAELDACQAAARLAADLQASTPHLVAADADLVLRGVRHPLLVLQGVEVVPGDVVLAAPARVLVVSGPNAGGKTVSLCAAGLCATMLQVGLPVPALPSSRLPLWGGLRCALGDAQSLEAGLSSFGAHLARLRAVDQAAAPGWLMLVDEMGADTDPQQGAALAQALLEHWAERGVRAIVTTHLAELKALAAVQPHFANARVGLDAGAAPTFRLEAGAAGLSNALAVARRVGLPAAVVARAEACLQQAGPLGAALEQLQRAQAACGRQAEQLAAAQAAQAEQEKQQAAAAAAAEAATQAAGAAMLAELEGQIRAWRGEIGAAVAALQAAPALRAAQAATNVVEAVAAQLAARRPPQVPPAAPPAAGWQVGQQAVVPRLGSGGHILEVGPQRALVAMGPLRTWVRLDELRPPPAAPPAAGPGRPGRRRGPRGAAAGAAPLPLPPAPRLDLRGLAREAAERRLETFLSDQFGAGAAAVLLVHGGAAGAWLPQALRRCPFVREVAAAPQSSADGAATWVALGARRGA